MFHLYSAEQLRLLSETHRNDLAAQYGNRGPSRVRPLLASILRRVANRLDSPATRRGSRDRPIRVLRLPTAELGNDRYIDVVIS